ncbi:MAG: epidermal growth factor receptor substrate 15 [Paraglaciecola sp.]|jgi:epidermal growth factor receptor substrate 15
MTRRSLFSLFTQAFWIGLLMVSPASFALGDKLLKQSVDVINVGLYAVAGLLILLLTILLIVKIKLRRTRQLFAVQHAELDNKRILFDEFNVGILHLDSSGEIIYANTVAGYFLGENPKQLVEVPLLATLDENYHDDLNHCMASEVFCSVQIFIAARNRHIKLSFKPQRNVRDNVANVVSIEDVSDFQSRLDQESALLTHHKKLFDCSQLGQLSLDVQQNTFLGNTLFAQTLQSSSVEMSGDLGELEGLVCKQDLSKWKQEIALGLKGKIIDFHCRFVSSESIIPTRVFGQAFEQKGNEEPTKLHLAVQDRSEIEEYRKLEDISQQRVRGVLRVNSHPMYVFDQEGKLQDCNTAFEMMFNTKLAKIQGRFATELDFFTDDIKKFHPADAISSKKTGPTLSSGGTTRVLSSSMSGLSREFELEHGDKTTQILRIKLQPFQDVHGNRAGVAGMIEDISALKQAQEQLLQEQKRFADMLNLAPLAIAMIDADDHVVQANNAMLNRLGLNQKELKKGSFYQLFNDPINSGKAAKQLHQTGRLRAFHAHLKGKNGELHPSELHIDLFNKEQQEYLCWISDISDEQFQHDKFEGLLQHSSMPMAVVGDKGFSQLNPAACEFFSIGDENELFGFFPYSPSLNCDNEAGEQLKQKFAQIKLDGQSLSMHWQHKNGDEILPCQITFVPMYKGHEFDSILCIWVDLRAITKADAARLEAINLHQAAERQVLEKQNLLESSQDQLANKVKSLSDTKTKLQAAEEDLTDKQSKFSDLQKAHQSVTDHLQKLQQDYSQSREMLSESQRSNLEFETQLEQSSVKVGSLEKQRNQIADALQYSEKQHKRAQHQLAESEKNTERLQQEQIEQQQKMDEFVAQIGTLKHSIEEKDLQINEVSSQINSLQSKLASSGQNTEKLRQLLLNQRKASEHAEQQRRELEQSCHSAQSELSNKARHIDHLQHEMQKFEEMSTQQKGDMAEQRKQLELELAAKQRLLQETQETLNETKLQSEKEKSEKIEQQKHLKKLQNELSEVERLTNDQQQKMAEAEQQRLEQQRLLQEELKAKQQKLQQTEQILSEAKQQTAAEKAEKAAQQQIFEKLRAELDEVEQRATEQQQKIEKSDQQWQQRQLELKRELEAKQQKLQESQQQLDENMRQADAEKRERLEQQQKLEQVKLELADVESRSLKQREMMQGSDEQMRQHHTEIEQQKGQLQQALAEAERQNAKMQEKLQGSLKELKDAESQVSETQTGEQKLQEELNQARRQAEALEQRLLQQEQQESKLQRQLSEQQKVLQEGERKFDSLQNEQQELTQALQAVQQEYTTSKQDLSEQDTNQSDLAKQLNTLEQELNQSKQQLDDKESALVDAQKQLESSQAKLVEQEQALLAAHKEELKQLKAEDVPSPQKPVPEYAKLDMPASPNVWFDLLPYLQKNPNGGPLAVALNALIDELEQVVEVTDKAVNEDDTTKILLNTRKLVALANKVNSEPLIDLATRLESYCQQGQVDSISIFWPNVKKSLMTTLRVIYSQLHA